MKYTFTLLLTILLSTLFAQTDTNKAGGGFYFSEIVNHGATEVKNQYRSGTCWSFSGLSFFESEMIRMGMEPYDISEMFIVRKAYELKAERYVRMHGKAQFGPGGQFHDVIHIAKNFGILKEEQYGGQPISFGKPMHNEMDAMLKSMVNVVVKNPNKKLSPYWKDAINGTLDAYLGPMPTENDPKQVAKESGLVWDDYVELTSFTHIPNYDQGMLLIPDNWMYEKYYNLPLDDFVNTVKLALKAGFTVAWDADVSDRGFSFKNGVAIVPEIPWGQMTKAARDTFFNQPGKEMEITPEKRQEWYDNYATTDDHLMHITGFCQDQNGAYYFIVKNSWGADRNDCKGYLYVSEAYFRANTIAVMLHKDAIPKPTRKKLNLE